MVKDVNAQIIGAAGFRWREFFRSSAAKKLGIDNTPQDPKIYGNIEYLARKVLQPVRDHFGAPIRVTSGYRSPRLNIAVGGSPASFHALGCAADIEPLDKNARFTVRDIFTYIHDNLPYTELIAEELPNGWVHVALQKGREKERQLKCKLLGGSVRRATYAEIMRAFA